MGQASWNGNSTHNSTCVTLLTTSSVVNLPIKEDANHGGVYVVYKCLTEPHRALPWPDLPPELRNPTFFEKGNIHGRMKLAYTCKLCDTSARLACLITPVFVAIYGRVNGKWHFKTALTSANPNAKGGRLVHPTVCASSESKISMSYIESYPAKTCPDDPRACACPRLPRSPRVPVHG